MAILENVLETILALAAVVLMVNIAFAVLTWLYAALFVGGSPFALLLAVPFIGLGAVIVAGYIGIYRS